MLTLDRCKDFRSQGAPETFRSIRIICVSGFRVIAHVSGSSGRMLAIRDSHWTFLLYIYIHLAHIEAFNRIHGSDRRIETTERRIISPSCKCLAYAASVRDIHGAMRITRASEVLKRRLVKTKTKDVDERSCE